jgi:hypothetical protein
MKKLALFLVLMHVFALKAETVERTQVTDYSPIPFMDFAFEIKTPLYDKIVLDCQSFVTGMTFYQNQKVTHSFYLDAYGECQGVHELIMKSREKNIPVCLEVETETNTLNVYNDPNGCELDL